MERYLGALLIFALIIFAKNFWPTPSVLAEATSQPADTLPVTQPVITESRFSQKLEEQTEILHRRTSYNDDPETEIGEEKVLEEGEDGKKVTIIKITYYQASTSKGPARSADESPVETQRGFDSFEVDQVGEEYSREVVSTEVTPAKDKLISRGTKIIWRTMDTSDGQIKFWRKLRVYATHYDSHCPGCNETTATGMRAGKGVIAVDPKVIPLRSKVYIPGYGVAVAGDTGGAIKGNIIDLGFDDARSAGWSAKFIDIYML